MGRRQSAEFAHLGDGSEVGSLVEVEAGRLGGGAGTEPGRAHDYQEQIGSAAHCSSEEARLG